MASVVKLSNPNVLINNDLVIFKPNSIEVTLGKGETKVEALSGGAGIVETAHTEDVSTKIGKVKGMLTSDNETETKIRTWSTLLGQNKITISEQLPNGETFHASFRNMSLINDPPIQFKSEPEVEIEFHGNPAV